MNIISCLKKIRSKLIGPTITRVDELEGNISYKLDLLNNSMHLANKSEKLEQQLNLIMEKLDEIHLDSLDENAKNKLQDKMTIYIDVIKELIKDKYSLIDKLDKDSLKDFKLTCPICGNVIDTDSTKKYNSECIFLGGKLERYTCNTCKAIVGPIKMLKLNSQELSKDYVHSYSVFSEGDSTPAEKEAFYSLNPTKEGCYLNYGCGDWSHSIEELRAEGYNVYGYEPYSSTSNSSYIITSEEILKSMKFDGIFSNNVLEHLSDPIERFTFFKGLLKDDTCLMSHATPCYEYCYEYTRFHLIFYTGKALDYLCKKTGFKIDRIIKKENPQDFICVIYKSSTLNLKSCVCKQEQLESVEFNKLCRELKVKEWFEQFNKVNNAGIPNNILHRKSWEYAYIVQALYERGMLVENSKGLGFAVGTEPLPAYFATKGCEILATDLEPIEESAENWIQTGQHAAGNINVLNQLGICDKETFEKKVKYKNVDMNDIPKDLIEFDFCWSSCAIEHVGSLEKSKQFIKNMLKTLKPGGIAVHTTEYNLSSNDETITEGDSVIYRRKDIEEIVNWLKNNGHEIEVDFKRGNMEGDLFVDQPPYYKTNPKYHMCLNIDGLDSTSFGLIIQKRK